MTTLTFEHTIQFRRRRLPIIRVFLIQPGGSRLTLPLLFDTGASTTTLRSELYPMLGLSRWDSGRLIKGIATASGTTEAYQYEATLELYGRRVTCPINLQKMPAHPLYNGLFGREGLFDEFGFGFWERTGKLYVTLNP